MAADPLNVNLGQRPVITVNFPPMPQPSDFIRDNDPNLGWRYSASRQDYENALRTWKEAVALMAQAINTK